MHDASLGARLVHFPDCLIFNSTEGHAVALLFIPRPWASCLEPQHFGRDPSQLLSYRKRSRIRKSRQNDPSGLSAGGTFALAASSGEPASWLEGPKSRRRWASYGFVAGYVDPHPLPSPSEGQR